MTNAPGCWSGRGAVPKVAAVTPSGNSDASPESLPPAHRPRHGRAARAGAAALAGLVLALGATWVAQRDATGTAEEGGAAPLASLLAVGDTGVEPGWLAVAEGQRAVGRGLAREDTRSPVAALLLLGDNFYERGLRARELVERVRENVVAPYCRFVDLSAPRSAEVRAACPDGAGRTPAPRLLAVLGNHDVRSDESPALQAGRVAELVRNWELSDRPARTVELGSGLSLVLFDSNHLRDTRDRAPLRAALREAAGPWRILAAHHPIGTRGKHSEGYEADVRRAVREAGVPVQLMLAGHEHNLQVVALDDPGPRVVVVAGAGARPRPVKHQIPGRLFGFEGLGFARVDLLAEESGERLRVTLFSAPRWASLLGLAPDVLGRWSVGPDDALAVEPLEIEVVEGP
jgi:hypothetical protein